jgi:hypothetical protein
VADWRRDTPWRQGHLLTADAIEALIPTAPEGASAVVVSHDCDLVSKEEQVELIVGKTAARLDGNKTFAKSPRVLQLEYVGAAGSCIIELNATEKRMVPKKDLFKFGPESKYTRSEPNVGVLQKWLAARYRRSAFPDAFNDCLEETKLRELIVKICRAHATAIRGLYFDVDHGDERVHLTHDDPFTLGIVLLVDSGSGDEAFEEAEKAKKKLEDIFEAKFYTAEGGWKRIKLEYCDVASDQVMTVHQALLTKEWKLEYISLETDPHAATLDS